MNNPAECSDIPIFTLAPSDLTFLWDECLRCFYMKVVLGQRRPSAPMPGVFTIFDREQRAFFDGGRTSELHESLPPGVVRCRGLSVCSAPILIPGQDISIRFRGGLDAALLFDSGDFGIVDFKTTEPKGRLAEFYSPQLHAYAHAVENPAFGREVMKPVTILGLLCFEPGQMVRLPDGDLAYRTTPSWLPIQRDDTSFFLLLWLVAELLKWTSPPKPTARCRWCAATSGLAPEPRRATAQEHAPISPEELHPQPMLGLGQFQ